MKKMLILMIATTLLSVNCSKNLNQEPGKKQIIETTKSWENNYTTGNLTYTTMKEVYNLSYDVSSILPSIDDSKIPYGDADDYLGNDGPLGYYGPLGPYGPLATLGPIGDNTWNASYWMSAWAYDDVTGPLGPNGPLGEDGPVAGNQYYGIEDPGLTLFQTNDFAVHSRALGVWAPVGPIGPLGALGALGPLGPVGAHGYSDNTNGEYVDSNNVVKRNVTMWFDAAQTTQRTYELYEVYPEAFAEAKTDNDTSFMAEGHSSSYSDEDIYEFTSATHQVVTITLVPEKQLDDFDLVIRDENGNLVAYSDTTTFIDWVQLKVPSGTKLKAYVKCYYSGHTLASTYRLYVNGSTNYINKTEITGDHISTWQ